MFFILREKVLPNGGFCFTTAHWHGRIAGDKGKHWGKVTDEDSVYFGRLCIDITVSLVDVVLSLIVFNSLFLYEERLQL